MSEPIEITDQGLGWLILGTFRGAVALPEYPVMVDEIVDNFDESGDIKSFTVVTMSGLRYEVTVKMEEPDGRPGTD